MRTVTTWPTILILIIGFSLAIFGYEAMEHMQQRQGFDQFQQLAQEKSYIAERQIDDALDTLVSLSTFYQSSEHVTNAESQLYANHFLKRYANLSTLLWIPVVSADDRQIFEDSQTNRQSAFMIQQWSDDKSTLNNASVRDMYYPVTYIAGKTAHTVPRGLDLGNMPIYSERLHHADDAATFILIPLDTTSTYYLALFPVHTANKTLAGYVGGIFDFHALFSPLQTKNGFKTHIHIWAANYPDVFYEQGNTGRAISTYKRQFKLANMTWHYKQTLLHTIPTWSVLWPPLIIFLSTLTVTCLLAMYIKFKTRQHIHTENLVKKRTFELSQATSRLKQQSLRLAKANTELQQFAYVASHDLQEPLRMIKSYGELLAQKLPGQLDKDSQDYMCYMLDAAKRMQQLIMDLLQYSRIESGQIRLVSVDMNAVLTIVLQHLSQRIKEKKADITFNSLPTVYGDKTQLISLLQNIISNALKYCANDRKAVIHIDCVRQRDEWIFTVKDNGIGINAADYERIFEIFQRLHTREEYDGTGIGLAICRTIVQRHHGHIWVESDRQTGSTFFFSLPTGKPAMADTTSAV